MASQLEWSLALLTSSHPRQKIPRLVLIAAAADAQIQPRLHVLAYFHAVAHLGQVFPVEQAGEGFAGGLL